MITRTQRNRYGLPKNKGIPILFVEPINHKHAFLVVDITQVQKYSKGYSLLLRLENGQNQMCFSMFLKEMQSWKEAQEVINSQVF